jgi:hypothetical protein
MGGNEHKAIIQNRNVKSAGSTSWSIPIGCITSHAKKKKPRGCKVDSYENIHRLFTTAPAPDPKVPVLPEHARKPEPLNRQIMQRAQSSQMLVYHDAEQKHCACLPNTVHGPDIDALTSPAKVGLAPLQVPSQIVNETSILEYATTTQTPRLFTPGAWYPITTADDDTVTKFGLVQSCLPNTTGGTTVLIETYATIYPPMKQSAFDCTNEERPRLEIFTISLIEATDIKGYYAHRGMEDGGDLTCPCYYCHTTKAGFQTKCIPGSECVPRTLVTQRAREALHNNDPKTNATQCANTRRAPFMMLDAMHTAPPFLHIMLGLVNNHRTLILTALRGADEEYHEHQSGANVLAMQNTIDQATEVMEQAQTQVAEIKLVQKVLRAEAIAIGDEYKVIARRTTKNTDRQNAIVAAIRYNKLSSFLF